ncbi:hypothetical protein MTR67_036916 [Solanum verrucosum]|uniref:Uncharacterized protein n=1 Tax=Solanum verrucosum TaxID=315347 RepID=A0AAF0ZLF1_SOLVR|nr:hypothetical protein MTR67_036916 [Solanum verrucosum]
MFSLPSLIELDLSDNHFSGHLEDFKSNSLSSIDLNNNQLQGRLPKSIQNLVNLTWLDLSSNNFSGNVDVSLFSNIKNLQGLDLSYNRFSLTNENRANFTLPESLFSLRLAACEVKELEFLRPVKKLWDLNLSNNKIQGRIPDWAWPIWLNLDRLNLSHNMLTDMNSTNIISLRILDVAYNALTETLPTSLFQHLKAMRTINRTMKAPVYLGDQYYQDSVTIVSKEESYSEFLDDFWKAALMGYGSGLCIGLSIIYFIISTGNPKWLAKIILKLEHKLMMRWKKIQRWHRNHRRNNRF